MSKFGGEGTGFKSMKDVNWKNNEDVTLTVKGEIGWLVRNVSWPTDVFAHYLGVIISYF